jgi:betaine-aldehyde dehydrogenase
LDKFRSDGVQSRSYPLRAECWAKSPAAEVAVKNVTLELGGKNSMIVFPNADYEKAVAAAVGGMNLAWSGQSCSSTSRLFLHESIHDKL